jgi:hypothetical protein
MSSSVRLSHPDFVVLCSHHSIIEEMESFDTKAYEKKYQRQMDNMLCVQARDIMLSIYEVN